MNELSYQNSLLSQKRQTFRVWIFRIFFSIFLGFAFGTILFGDSSLDTLTSLETKNYNLKNEILSLQKQNEKLQKEYFELKNIQGF